MSSLGISLGQGCEFKSTAVHELMHALGFCHEQSRPDREQFINSSSICAHPRAIPLIGRSVRCVLEAHLARR
ncbi:M12 family metallopeptidase [Stigmatella aurantiaca]|uniref:M12 family metallopeptidase n=1 Tax=Stigmatella aurantiaca TaxID=41 RepID=UPI0009D915B9